MLYIIALLRKYKYLLLFLGLELVGFILTSNYQSYHRSKYINASNGIFAGLHRVNYEITHYFGLKKENQSLQEENLILLGRISVLQSQIKDSLSQNFESVFTDFPDLSKTQITKAEVIVNQYENRNNYLIIDKGSRDSIKLDQGVFNHKGILGIINHTSNHYSSVMSILNPEIKLNVRLKNSSYFGSLSWDGSNYNTLQIEDLPRQATIAIGDTIVTGGRSLIFPDGIPVGKVKTIRLQHNIYKSIDVELFNDMADINHVYIIEQKQIDEAQDLIDLNNGN
jgi:rod shape-determining protein MreC